MSAILRAIEHFGSEAKLARAAGVSQPAIHKAKNADRVSAELAIKIEAAMGGRIRRSELRPDLWPPEALRTRPKLAEAS